MSDLDRADQLQTLANSLDALIAFADAEEDYVLAATLDSARVQLTERHLVR